MTKIDVEDFERIQAKLQAALDGETMENTITMLSAVLVVAVCVGVGSRTAAHRTIDKLAEAMHANVERNGHDYVEQYADLSRARTH